MKNGFLVCIGIFISFSCAPKIYVVDRQSVFEQESAGEWPKFESEMIQKTSQSGPTPFAKVPTTEKKERIYRVLNGELISKASEKKGDEAK